MCAPPSEATRLWLVLLVWGADALPLHQLLVEFVAARACEMTLSRVRMRVVLLVVDGIDQRFITVL